MYCCGGDGEQFNTVTREAGLLSAQGYKEPVYASGEGNSLPNADKALNGQAVINSQDDAFELPHTGGIGTRIFTVMGILLTVCAGFLLWKIENR